MEGPFQLLHDLAVAADWASSRCKLQLIDENQVVQFLAAGQGDGAEGLGLVAFAIAEEGPHPRRPGVGLDAAIDHVMVEPRLIDRHDGAQAHRDRGKFPKVGHQPGMRIRRQSAAGRRLAAKVFQLLLAQPARRNARAYMPGAAWP